MVRLFADIDIAFLSAHAAVCRKEAAQWCGASERPPEGWRIVNVRDKEIPSCTLYDQDVLKRPSMVSVVVIVHRHTIAPNGKDGSIRINIIPVTGTDNDLHLSSDVPTIRVFHFETQIHRGNATIARKDLKENASHQ